ncbi:MAG: hypothetical protein HY816_15140 [Candidatus Wallbacteria bacterium]|nr:hypothetical protein [Candidatus Wallbacteria bacterium]
MNWKRLFSAALVCTLLAPTAASAFHEPGYGDEWEVPTPFSRREIMDMGFANLELSAMFVTRVKKTPTDLLEILGKRAAFTAQHDDNPKAVWNARKVMDILRRLGVTVPGGDNPPPPQPPPPPPNPPPPTPPPPPNPPPPNPPPPPEPPPTPPPNPPPPTPPPTPPPPPPPEPPPPPNPPPPNPPPNPPPPPPPEPPPPPNPPPPPPPDQGNGPVINPGEVFDVSDYYPVNIGNYWKYTDLAVNKIFRMDVKKQIDVNGQKAYYYERDDKIETDAITVGADGISLHDQQRTNSDGSLFHAVWTPQVKFAQLKTKFGEKQTTVPSFRNPGTGNTMTWVATVVGTQDVQVPAGKYKNCVRIKVLVTDTVLGVKLSDFEMWVAKGIGVVQRQGNFFGVYFVQKLLEYKVIPRKKDW